MGKSDLLSQLSTPEGGQRNATLGGGGSNTTWQAVRNAVLARVRSHEWPPGQLIPTEKQLAAEWGCARATVNRALRDLAESGVVERRRKVGTRVVATRSARATRQTSLIWNNIHALGAEYGYRLLTTQQVAADDTAARRLQLPPHSPVMFVAAVFLADGRPYCCEASWLSTGELPTIDPEEFANGSVQEWLERLSRLTHSRSHVLATTVHTACASALEVMQGAAVLTVERTDWAEATPLVFTRQYYPPGHRLRYSE